MYYTSCENRNMDNSHEWYPLWEFFYTTDVLYRKTFALEVDKNHIIDDWSPLSTKMPV
jgi:hypothetical protein